MTTEKPIERRCEHANPGVYDTPPGDGKFYLCNLDGRCDKQWHYGEGKPFCKIPLSQETWYDEAGKPRFNIWHVEGKIGELLKMCCIPECKKIQIGETWLARNQGENLYAQIVAQHDKPQKITHTYCPKCFEDAMAEIKGEKK